MRGLIVRLFAFAHPALALRDDLPRFLFGTLPGFSAAMNSRKSAAFMPSMRRERL
jgi:hypothetical protein